LLLLIPVLLGVMLLVFGMVFLSPGDPISRLAGNKPLPASTVAGREFPKTRVITHRIVSSTS